MLEGVIVCQHLSLSLSRSHARAHRRTQYEHPSLTCNDDANPDGGDFDDGGDLKRDDRLGSGISKKSQNTVSSSGGHSAPHSDLGSFSGNSLTAPVVVVGGGEPRGEGVSPLYS